MTLEELERIVENCKHTRWLDCGRTYDQNKYYVVGPYYLYGKERRLLEDTANDRANADVEFIRTFGTLAGKIMAVLKLTDKLVEARKDDWPDTIGEPIRKAMKELKEAMEKL